MNNAKLDKITNFISKCQSTDSYADVLSSEYDNTSISSVDSVHTVDSVNSLDNMIMHLTTCNNCRQKIKYHTLHANDKVDRVKESLIIILFAIVAVIFLDVFVRFVYAKD